MKNSIKQRHFTLIELIVAMAIFLIIMMVLAIMLSDTMKLSRRRKQRAELLQKQQILGNILATDFKNLVVSNESGCLNPLMFTPSVPAAFVTTSSIGVDVDDSTPCPLNRVRYAVDNGYLYRGIEQCNTPHNPFTDWNIVDSDVIAENVKEISIDARLSGSATPLTGNEGIMPDLVTIVVTFYDENDSDENKKATWKYVKRVFIDRGGN